MEQQTTHEAHLFPQVEDAMSGTRFGRDAMAKAEAVVQRAEQDLARELPLGGVRRE